MANQSISDIPLLKMLQGNYDDDDDDDDDGHDKDNNDEMIFSIS